MAEIREEIQCYADPEKVCPLRKAQSAARELRQAPVEERSGPESYVDQVKGIASSLTWHDRWRFYAMLGTEMGRSVLEPESCENGPVKDFGFFGKVVCNAKSRHEEWTSEPIDKQAA